MCLQSPVFRHIHGYAPYSSFSEAEAFDTKINNQESRKTEEEETTEQEKSVLP